VTVRNGRTEAARRTLALVPEALEVLRRRVAGAVGGRLFVGDRGGTNSLLHTLDAWHSKLMDDTGMAFVIYAFRHTFATRMAVNGCPLATLAEILGHSGLRCVGRYLHPGQAAQEDSMRRYQGCDHFCARTGLETPVFGLSGESEKGTGPLTPNN
jgi:integrase